MRKFVGLGVISAFLMTCITGCPNTAEQRQEFLAGITDVQDSGAGADSQVSRQTLADISTRLSDATVYETTSTSSSGNVAANIGDGSSSQNWNPSLYVFNGVGEFGSSSGDTPPAGSDTGSGGSTGSDGGGSTGSDPGNPPPSGGGGGGDVEYFSPINPPPPSSRGGTTWSGTVTGSDTEVVIGCCDGVFSASGIASVFANSGGDIVGLSMPGFATLPALQVAVGAPGSSESYTGQAPAQPNLSYNIVVTTRGVSASATGFDITLDVAVTAQGGSLVENGSAVHHVVGTYTGANLSWTSQTNYAMNMFASAPGQPDVDIDVTQVWVLGGTLVRN